MPASFICAALRVRRRDAPIELLLHESSIVVRDRALVFPGLRLDTGLAMTLLKGTLSFLQDSDLSLQSMPDDASGVAAPEQGYVLRISGQLDVPKVSFERLVAHRPAD